MVLIAENSEKLKNMVEKLNREGRKAGLEINYQKTEILGKGGKNNIQIERETVEEVEELVYLGQLRNFHRRREKEIRERIRKGWRNYWNLKAIYNSKIGLKKKIKILQGTTVPAITHGAQTWALTRNQEQKLWAVQRNIERKIAGIRWEQKISNEKVK